MSLQAAIAVRRGEFHLDVELDVAAREVIVLLGPNGSGKSTLLGVLCGLIAPEASRIVLDGRVLEDSETGAYVLPQDRQVGMVFQDYLLFPRLTALHNVAFGLRARGVPRAAADERAMEWLKRVGLYDLADNRPRQLSGGQAQRVALARALITEPRLLLLDEPLAALDAGTRATVRADLSRHLRNFDGCTLIVTHDPLEAMALADRILVLEAGRIVQQGSPAEVARRPRTDYVARLVGLNLVRGVATNREVTLSSGAPLVLGHPTAGPVLVAFSPTAVTLHRRQPEGSARNVWPGQVRNLEPHGDLIRVVVEGEVPLIADVTPLAVSDLDLSPGREVWASVKATEMSAYPA